MLIANSNLVPAWANWKHFRELDRKGLMMFGQMTAGSWIYIGSQGIVQGTYETFVELGRQHYGGDLVRPLDPDCRTRRHGRGPTAGGEDGRGVLFAGDRVPGPTGSKNGLASGYLDTRADTVDRGAVTDRGIGPGPHPALRGPAR